MTEIMKNNNVKIPNLYADIIPGKSAAGFEIGVNIADLSEIVSNATPWRKEFGSIDQGVRQTPGWFYFSNQLCDDGSPNFGDDYYFGYGAVKLHFSTEGALDWIQLDEGYQGVLFGSIKIGDKLTDVLKYVELEYDDVEELHIPITGSDIDGLLFFAEENTLEISPDQIIYRIFVSNGFQ
jgi:hypothetical protein